MQVDVAQGPKRAYSGRVRVTLTTNVAETTLIAADANNFIDLTALVFTNTSASATVVTLRDATGAGTPWLFAVPANASVIVPLDIIGRLIQGAKNNNWTVQSSASISSLECMAAYVKNAN